MIPSLSQIGSFTSDTGAEIVAFDDVRQLLYAVSGNATVYALDISDPADPQEVFSVDLAFFGAPIAGANSIAYNNGLLAIALQAEAVTDPGAVAVVNLTQIETPADVLAAVKVFTVGSLPDMVTFTPDGSKVLVANEGEPQTDEDEPDFGIDPDGSVSIIDVSGDFASLSQANVSTADFLRFNGREADLRADGVRIFPDAMAAQDIEPEYIAVSPDGTKAFVTLQENNAIAIIDIASATVESIQPLGLKDYSVEGNGLDASDRDNAINIQPQPVFGLYMPDSIAAFESNGETFYVIANEGDDRGDADEPGRGDAIRLKDIADVVSLGRSGLSLDPALEAQLLANDLLADEALGRLTISSIDGDTDGDGDLDRLVAYGGRSFSVLDSKGSIIFDSGDQIERITAELAPELFNANDGDPAEIDTRSDNKGPEPEAITTGIIDGKPYAFVGLERAGGGILVYDLSNPSQPEFIQYVRSDEDIAPEGLAFISAEKSPNGQPLLAVANEVSSTVSFYGIGEMQPPEAEVKINEIRIDQPGTDIDEYFELAGTPGTSLDGLTYLVIGDGSTGSGTIEAVVDLTGQVIGSGGFFVAAESTFTLGTADLVSDLNFENSDNVTHLLVKDFTGALGDDLDTDDDGIPETTPWASVLDSVALIEDLNNGEQVYSDTQVGPDGSFVPGQVFRSPDATGDFQIGAFDPAGGSDTPGIANRGDGSGGGNGGGDMLTPIYNIQGAGQVSALVGASVTTGGIVTAVDTNGFYLQDALGDGDIATSDALFVFTGDAPGLAVGDELEVAGTVSEFTPGGVSTGNLSTTQISGSPIITPLSTGNALPAVVIIGAGGRVPPAENIDDDAFGSFDPVTDGIDFFESVEGMRVTAEDLLVVNGTNRFGEIFAVANQGANATGLSSRQTLNISPDDFNPERIQINQDTGILPGFSLPTVNAGALLGDVTGVVGYGFGNFEILPTEVFEVVADATLTPESTTLTGGSDQLTIATYNVLNLELNDDDGDTDVADGRFEAIAQQIVSNLGAPDIVGLQEIQDNSGAADDGTVAADETLQALVEGIAAAGGPTYEFIDNTFISNNSSGGQPGGNIRTAFLYNPDRVTQVGEVQAVGDQSSGSPFEGARLPLVATFDFNGEAVTVVNNHFSSKGGSAPILGTEQDFAARQEDPSVNGSLDERRQQAQAVNDFVDGVIADNADANIVVIGDLNEFEFVSPLQILAGTTVSTNGGQDIAAGGTPILTNLVNNIPEDERYSFIFQGNSQALDHILVSDALAAAAEIDIVHVNSEFAETPQRASDHDPLVTRLTFGDSPMETFTLQLLHLADQEAGIPALDDAPRASAVINALKDDYANTLLLSSGDAIIPGLFFTASQEVYGGAGRADILIQNELGIQAIAFGNHEFDLGPELVRDLIAGGEDDPTTPDIDESFVGTQFPYLSSNLDFSTSAALAGLVVPDDQAPQPNSIAATTVIDVNGEKIGVVGATTPTLPTISSPGDVTVLPEDFDGTPTPEQLDALAAEIQKDVDELLAANPDINKVVLLAHMQQISIEQELATRLSNVDIIVAGGSNTRLFDENDRPRDGDTVQGEYPIFKVDADGNPVAIVNTDGNYKYIGQLVIDFDANGVIIPESYDPAVSGAYATDAQGVAALNAEGLVDPEIQAIVDALEAVIVATESNVFGVSDVYLNGLRSSVRTQETNLGNLTADANLAIAQQTDDSVVISIKNGGGIRDDIGQVIVPPGGTGEPERLPTEEIPGVKPVGGISQNDIANSLQFNNGLTLLTVTAEELLALIEYGVSASAPDDAVTPGQFPQVAGIEFSFDVTAASGDRVQSLVVLDEDGNDADVIVQNSELVGAGDRTFRLVTLGFLADGGDGYTFPMRDVVDLARADDAPRTGAATFAPDGSEQDALAEYLAANFGAANPFDRADTPREEDTRIQNLAFRADTVIDGMSGGGGGPVEGIDLLGTVAGEELIGTEGNDTIAGLGGSDIIRGTAGDDVLRGDGNRRAANAGASGDDIIFGEAGNDRIGGKLGNDMLFGEAGDDTLYGDGGDDILRGGLGNDVLFGDDRRSSGSDTFILAAGEGTDLIMDFEVSKDLIGLASGINFGQLSFSDNKISFEDEVLAMLNGVDTSSLSASSFVPV